MKKCSYCGNEFDDSAKFCTECGAKLEENVVVAVPEVEETNVVEEVTAVEETPVVESAAVAEEKKETPVTPVNGQNPPKKKKKGLKIALIIGAIIAAILGIGLVAIVAIVIFVVVMLNKTTTIDMNEYVRYQFNGYDTAGEISAYIDAENFMKDYIEASKADESTARSQAWFIYANTSLEISKSQGLLNDEEIEIRVYVMENSSISEYLDDSKIELETGSMQVTVNGLLPITHVNPFEHITITQTGIDGDIYIEIQKDFSHELMDDISIDVSDSYDLNIGDVVTLSIDEYYIKRALELGYGITKSTMEYEVGDADKYYTDINEVDEETVTLLKDKLLGKINTYLDNNASYFTGTDILYEGAYLLTSEEGYYRNYVLPVYSVVITGTDEEEIPPTCVYMSFMYYNLLDTVEGEDTWYDYSWNIEGNSGLYYSWFSQVKGHISLDDLYREEIEDFVKDGYTLTYTGNVRTGTEGTDTTVDGETETTAEDAAALDPAA